MASMAVNNLLEKVARNQVCTSVGIKIVPSAEAIFMAKTAGYDSVFLELEHSTFALPTASSLCAVALASGVTPFVRVPHQCGNGFVQRVLDNGAMGVVFPHIKTVEDAKNAASICKFPPQGTRSLTAGLPQFWCSSVSPKQAMENLNARGSTVFLMVETKEMLEDIDQIAAVPGVDVLLVGANDLGIEIGCLGEWDSHVFTDALEKISAACRTHGKIMGLAGLYHRPDIMTWAVQSLGVRYVLGGLDLGMLSAAMIANAQVLRSIDVPVNGKRVKGRLAAQ